MATSKSLEFLPNYLRTEYNRRFFGSTLDKLITEPRTKRFNGFVGREFAPVYRAGDQYIQEDNQTRQNYQLEPAVVVTNQNKQVDFFASYTDLLQKINYYGGITDNHSRLFSTQDYNYNGRFDLDKLVNFSQYYWLPNGPTAVEIGFGFTPSNKTFEFNFSQNSYSVVDYQDLNPEIVLRRGGTYTFDITQVDGNFWIQTEPSLNGYSVSSPNQLVRLGTAQGVVNNGTSSGSVTFTVPAKNSQDSFASMASSGDVNFAVELTYSQIQHKKLSDFIADNGYIDGYKGNLTNKLIIFVNQQTTSDVDWTGDSIPGYPGSLIPLSERIGVYRIKFVSISGEDYIKLELVNIVTNLTSIFITEGETFSGLKFYRDGNFYQSFPLISADKDFLYYQNSSTNSYGKIRLIDVEFSTIDVEAEILGKVSYTSPNGVRFTNGLKVSLDGFFTPTTYANAEFYVQGVGKSINLVPVRDLYDEWQPNTSYTANNYFVYQNALYAVLINFTSGDEFESPGVGVGSNYELYDNTDYITISLNSRDFNDWTQKNRWFHQDIIALAAEYNNTVPLYNQNYRAKRPIIEFEENLQLYNIWNIMI